jgi:2-oxo-4-hydroxy-4-carboxy-5-ureidoimidazoline decarboxylase
MSLEEFNALPQPEAAERLRTCLDVQRWVDQVLAGRPYADQDALLSVARNAAVEMTDEELGAALARHPRIGEKAGAGHDAAFSAREQAGVEASDAERLVAANRAYEARFDRVFLIRAAGRRSGEILAECERRLGNDDEAERAETIEQLTQIALLRLEQVI